MNRDLRFWLIVLLLGVLIVSSTTTHAAVWVFDVVLDGSQEVPSVVTPGSGSATVLICPFFKRLSIRDTGFGSKGVFSNLSGTVTAAHVHGPAAAGTNGPVIIPLDIDLGVTSGNFTTPIQPTQPNDPYGFPLTDQQYQDALNGLLYINIHTTAFPGGEIRGQLINPISVPEPMSLSLIAMGSIGLLYRRRR